MANGTAKKEQNGTAKLIENGGTANKAADYYVRGEVPAEITQRKIK